MSLFYKVKPKVRSGNTVSHSERKVKRFFKPNVHKFRFYSSTLKNTILIKCTCRVRRSILCYGTIDNYLISNKNCEKDLIGIRNKILKSRERIISSRSFRADKNHSS